MNNTKNIIVEILTFHDIWLLFIGVFAIVYGYKGNNKKPEFTYDYIISIELVIIGFFGILAWLLINFTTYFG